ncbi:MAG TPA: Rrf2 family transcriptional regulator [Phycisphaerales bacterium]|nr:Rrf2 family transcriptional regulator [Phycisphaerales bacterium]
MKHGNQVEWALHCAATLAALEPGVRLSAQALAELYEAPPKYLAKALQALSRAGLVESTSGPRGGYTLARPARDIRVIDIVQAVQGEERLFQCTEIRRKGPCRKVASSCFTKTCQLASIMWSAESAWRKELEKHTLESILRSVEQEVSPVILKVVRGWVEEKAS